MNNSPFNDNKSLQPSDRYCIGAIVFLCLAMFFLSVVVFTVSPLTILGIISTCIGVLLMLGCIVCFVLYSRALKKEEEHLT